MELWWKDGTHSLTRLPESCNLSRVFHLAKEPILSKERTPKKPREQYRLPTGLIHGSFAAGRWDYDHHVVPPQSSSATYRLTSVDRGAEGFVEFATPESRRAPFYIYDRLDEPGRGMLERNLRVAAGGETAVAFATGMAAVKIHADFCDLMEPESLPKVATRNCRAVYFETPVPTMELIDMRRVRSPKAAAEAPNGSWMMLRKNPTPFHWP